MLVRIFKNIIFNFQEFIVIWAVAILLNQLFLFGACFAPYCLIAALPHTFVIAALGVYLTQENESSGPKTDIKTSEKSLEKFRQKRPEDYKQLEERLKSLPENQVQTTGAQSTTNAPHQLVYCPKCGSKMVKRTARQGVYQGKKFWGCTTYPECKGIIDIKVD